VPEFGDKFRKTREAKKLSLDDVSRVTKISARMLQAIEQEHFDQLPGGVFNRGFIRAYAKHLGLNDEEAVNDYLACLRQAQIEANQFRESVPVPVRTVAPTKTAAPVKPAAPLKPAAPVKAAPPQPTSTSRTAVEEVELPDLQLPRSEDVSRPARSYPARSQSSFPSMTILVAIIVVLVIALIWTRHSRSTGPRAEAAQTTKAVTQQASMSQPAPSQPVPPTHAAPPAPAPANNSPAPGTAKPATPSSPPEKKSVDNKSQPANNKADASSLTAQSSLLTANPETKQPSTNSGASDVTVRTPVKAAHAAKPAASMTLIIRATENTSISVVADGQLVKQETLIAPANTTVRASREITVKVGNAAAVSFLWNNQEIPAHGAEAGPKTLVFDAQGLRTDSAPATPQN